MANPMKKCVMFLRSNKKEQRILHISSLNYHRATLNLSATKFCEFIKKFPRKSVLIS